MSTFFLIFQKNPRFHLQLLFGGSRWTSDLAINYYETVLSVAAAGKMAVGKVSSVTHGVFEASKQRIGATVGGRMAANIKAQRSSATAASQFDGDSLARAEPTPFNAESAVDSTSETAAAASASGEELLRRYSRNRRETLPMKSQWIPNRKWPLSAIATKNPVKKKPCFLPISRRNFMNASSARLPPPLSTKSPASIVLAVAEKEGSKPGQWVRNSDGSHDVGTMQFNTSYLRDLAQHGITARDVATAGCYP